jgi:hypothetical protein
VPEPAHSADLRLPGGVCIALQFLNRNPTILSQPRVIVNPLAEVLCDPSSAPVSRPLRSAGLVSDPRLRNPLILPYAYADVKGLPVGNFL